MSLADDLYSIGLKIEQLKALRPEITFSVENKQDPQGDYFNFRADYTVLSSRDASYVIDVFEALRQQYLTEDSN